MEKNTGKKFVTQGKHGILSRLECGHPDDSFDSATEAVTILFHLSICFQGAMSATFKAINASPKPALEPVGASFLAQRRGKNRPKSSTEV